MVVLIIHQQNGVIHIAQALNDGFPVLDLGRQLRISLIFSGDIRAVQKNTAALAAVIAERGPDTPQPHSIYDVIILTDSFVFRQLCLQIR